MWLLKGNERETSDIMTQQWNKYAHLKNNAKCYLSLNIKKGYATTWNAQISSQIPMQPSLYESLNTISSKQT